MIGAARQNSKNLAPHGHSFSSNAPVVSFLKIRISRKKIFNIRHLAGKELPNTALSGHRMGRNYWSEEVLIIQQ
jgi:hypothetical protein